MRRTRRQYDMQVRGQAQAEIRERAVAAACNLLAAPAYRELTLEAVAETAGVTRVTVYNHFGSRRGLLLAVFTEVGRRMGAERIREAMRASDVRQALCAVFAESTRAWRRERRTVGRIFALAALDAEIGREVARSERGRRAGLSYLARRLAEGSELSRHVTIDEATAVLGALTSFQTYEALAFEGKGAQLDTRLVAFAEGALGLRWSMASLSRHRR